MTAITNVIEHVLLLIVTIQTVVNNERQQTNQCFIVPTFSWKWPRIGLEWALKGSARIKQPLSFFNIWTSAPR